MEVERRGRGQDYLAATVLCGPLSASRERADINSKTGQVSAVTEVIESYIVIAM